MHGWDAKIFLNKISRHFEEAPNWRFLPFHIFVAKQHHFISASAHLSDSSFFAVANSETLEHHRNLKTNGEKSAEGMSAPLFIIN
jgi:hypothetical protein